MHEIGLTEDILRMILEKAKGARLKVVKRAKVKIGETHVVTPEEIKEIFSGLSKGTIAEGALLDIEITPLRAKCSSCKAEFGSTSSLSCPHCGEAEIEIISGQELLVEYIK